MSTPLSPPATPTSTLPTARVLTIAGSDSGGGAGVQADLKTMLALGVHGMSVIASVTAQNSLGVQSVWPSSVEAVRAQFRSVVDDIGVDAVKTGMLGSVAMVTEVAALLRTLSVGVPVVVDPVCASKHGDALIDDEAINALREELLPLATVVTPNLGEAALLTGLDAADPPKELAEALLTLGPAWVLVTGGHAVGDPVDLLTDGRRTLRFAAERSDNQHTHGTGCTLASALASRLALGDTVGAAMAAAKTYVTGAVRAGFALGEGIGPTDHLWALRGGLEVGGSEAEGREVGALEVGGLEVDGPTDR